ncbi:MAG: prepilin-type N-terminal cleavage/methylation domain-containing protein [Alphaproteobacteria bacterium]|nr:prepilin-type N-terminal cleavage/methylation domain-containing protein [Alphaproteobacteria bacterium]
MRPYSRNHSSYSSGFTLLELSIVLVVVGLLIGGVLLGRNLIHNAEVQSIAKQKEDLVRAVLTFQDRYNALPGDIANATEIWGPENSDYTACAALTTPSTTPTTCNGDGATTISNLTDGTVTHERHRAWQHLANASLIEGTYTGVQGPGGAWHGVPGSNAPSSQISGVGWGMFYIGAVESSAQYFDGSYGHALFVGKASATSTPNTAFLTADEAWGLDKKYDDGLPARGNIVSKWAASNCHDGSSVTDFDANYIRTNTTSDVCPLIFRNNF